VVPVTGHTQLPDIILLYLRERIGWQLSGTTRAQRQDTRNNKTQR